MSSERWCRASVRVMIASMRPATGDYGSSLDLESLYHEHYRSLVRLAALLVDDVGVCEELVQEAFVKMFVARERLRDPAKAPAYLRSAVLNGARSHLRRGVTARRRLSLAPASQPSAEAGAIAHDDEQAVLDALRSLPDRQRDVLVLRYWLGSSEAEIAETIGIAPGTVKTHVRRGLETLARKLEDRR
jgi:RNA polymerase sigma-70 factor (sigma-E family)